MKNPRKTTYLQRRAGAGIGGHMTKQIRAAHQASTDPAGTQHKLGLADVKARKLTLQHKVALAKARRARNKRRGY